MAVASTLFCGVVAACLDLTPVVYDVEAGTAPADAQADVTAALDVAADADGGPSCISCLTSRDDAAPPGCAEDIALCKENAACAIIYACALADHCFEQPSFRDIVNCGVPCVAQSGVVSASDPALTLIYDIATCAQANCNGPCHIGDASIVGG